MPAKTEDILLARCLTGRERTTL